MKKPMAKKAMPAKKGAAKMAAKSAMPMMMKGGMAKKYMGGGSIGMDHMDPMKKKTSSVGVDHRDPMKKPTMRKGGKAMMRKSGKSC